MLIALTVATGATDAISFLALGGVFTSVITANLALLGLSAVTFEPGLAGYAAAAVAAFVTGVLVSARVAGQGRQRAIRRVRAEMALAAALLVWCAFCAVWVAVGGRPGGGERLGLLAAAAFAMGIQSGVVRIVSPTAPPTTYLTGFLTGVLTDWGVAGRPRWPSAAPFVALAAGAAGGGVLIRELPFLAPALPVGLLAFVLGGSALTRLGRPRPPGNS